MVTLLNLQQIPSKSKEIRLMFKAGDKERDTFITDDFYMVALGDEVLTDRGWIDVSDVNIGDLLIGEDNKEEVMRIEMTENSYKLYVREGDKNEQVDKN